MRLRTTSAIFGAIAALGFATGGAQALPASKALDPGASGTAVEKVNHRWNHRCHWSPYRGYHCYWTHYRPYRPYYSYGYGYPYYSYGYSPGFSLYVGPRYRYRRGWW